MLGLFGCILRCGKMNMEKCQIRSCFWRSLRVRNLNALRSRKFAYSLSLGCMPSGAAANGKTRILGRSLLNRFEKLVLLI